MSRDHRSVPDTARAHVVLTRPEIRLIVIGLMLGGFLSALNQTIVATSLPSIGRELGNFETLSWVVIAYLLSSTVVAPLYGKLSDIHGRRAMMLVALALFIAGSAAAALAPNMGMLIAARTLQGIGGGGIVPVAQTTMADIILPRERGRYQAYMITAWVAAGFLGPVLGGIITERWHWSWVFWLNVPLGLVAVLLTSSAMARLPRYGRPHKLDIVGAALMTLAAVAFLVALTSGGTRIAWTSPAMFGLVATSVVLTFALGWRLKRTAEPFLPLTVLSNPVMQAGTTASACALGVMTGLMIYMPLYYQVVHGMSPTQAGLALVPIVVMGTFGSMASGRAMMHLRHYKLSPYVGLGLATAAVAALAWLPAMPPASSALAAGTIGFGAGTVFPVATISVQNAVSHHEVGAATGAMNFFRALNSALVVAIMGAILLSGFGSTFERGGTSADFLATAAGVGANAALVFRWVFVAALIFSVIALIALHRLEERPLRGPAASVSDP